MRSTALALRVMAVAGSARSVAAGPSSSRPAVIGAADALRRSKTTDASAADEGAAKPESGLTFDVKYFAN